MFFLFSDQSRLAYLPERKLEGRNFYELLRDNTISLADYPEWNKPSLDWLRSRGTIHVDDDGFIRLDQIRAQLLWELFSQEVICVSYIKDKSLIDRLVQSGDLIYGSSLFSIPEQRYVNYVFNKKEYSNGLDLRNKYIHGTYGLDEKQQYEDYIILLKIWVLVVLKINEEFCLTNPAC